MGRLLFCFIPVIRSALIVTALWVKPILEILWQTLFLCALFLFVSLPALKKSCGVIDAKSQPACWVPTHTITAWKGRLDCEEVSGLFISLLKLRLVYCRGDPHCVAQTLAHRLFTITMLTLALSLAVRRNSYLCIFIVTKWQRRLYFQNALVSLHWHFSSTTADQTEPLPTLCFPDHREFNPLVNKG